MERPGDRQVVAERWFRYFACLYPHAVDAGVVRDWFRLQEGLPVLVVHLERDSRMAILAAHGRLRRPLVVLVDLLNFDDRYLARAVMLVGRIEGMDPDRLPEGLAHCDRILGLPRRGLQVKPTNRPRDRPVLCLVVSQLCDIDRFTEDRIVIRRGFVGLVEVDVPTLGDDPVEVVHYFSCLL